MHSHSETSRRELLGPEPTTAVRPLDPGVMSQSPQGPGTSKILFH